MCIRDRLSASIIPVTTIPGLSGQVTTNVGHPDFLSPHSNPIVSSGDYIYVTNTPADTVDVIDPWSRRVVQRINVGVDPVGLAVRPDINELWVANHISDSISVIDTDPSSQTYHQVIATVQALEENKLVTQFEDLRPSLEPCHAFYVAIKESKKFSKDTIVIVNSCGDEYKYREILKRRLGKMYV